MHFSPDQKVPALDRLESVFKNVYVGGNFFVKIIKVLNKRQYLKGFYTDKKLNNSFLKLHYYLLRMPKIIEIG